MTSSLFILVFRLLIVACAIWVGFDSARLGAKRGVLGGGIADIGPVSWFFCVLLLWIIAMPLYLATRPKYVVLHQRQQFGGTMQVGGYGQPHPQHPSGQQPQFAPQQVFHPPAETPSPQSSDVASARPASAGPSFAPPAMGPSVQGGVPRFTKATEQDLT